MSEIPKQSLLQFHAHKLLFSAGHRTPGHRAPSDAGQPRGVSAPQEAAHHRPAAVPGAERLQRRDAVLHQPGLCHTQKQQGMMPCT